MNLMNIENGVQVTSNMVAELTGKRHDHVIRDIEEIVGVIGLEEHNPDLGSDIFETTYVNRGRDYKNYTMTKDGLMLIVTGYSAGHRMKLIKYCRELEAELNKVPALPRTYAEALLEAGRLAQIVEEQAPKVEYHDEVITAVNALTTTQVAKCFGFRSATQLNSILVDEGVQYKIAGQWVLKAKYSGLGYTDEDTFVDVKHRARHTTKWTELGKKFIYDLLVKEEYLK